jgi:hypothetical protein
MPGYSRRGSAILPVLLASSLAMTGCVQDPLPSPTPNVVADEEIARDYVNRSSGTGDVESAAEAWAAYRRAPGYLESTWVFNGGFEFGSFGWTTSGGRILRTE